MKLNFCTESTFFTLLFLQEIYATFVPPCFSRYDITGILNEIFIEMFKNATWREEFQLMSDAEVKKFHRLGLQIKNFPPLCGYKMFLNFGITPIAASDVTIRWDFSKGRLHVSQDVKRIYICGSLEKSLYPFATSVCRFGGFPFMIRNFSISAKKLSTARRSRKKVQIDVSHDCITCDEGIQLLQISKHKWSYEEQLRIKQTISLALVSAVWDKITYSIKKGDFDDLLNKTFSLNPKQRINSIDANFSLKASSYYYFIREIPIVNASLRNVKIFGLWDFEPYFFHGKTEDKRRFTLIVKNVRGNMTFDSGFKQWPQFPLNFTTHQLSISADQEISSVRVKLQNCRIFEEIPQPSGSFRWWLTRFSTFMIELLESAIETSIISRMKGEIRSSFSSSETREAEKVLVEMLNKSAVIS